MNLEYLKEVVERIYDTRYQSGCGHSGVIHRYELGGKKRPIIEMFMAIDFDGFWDIWNSHKDELKTMGIYIDKRVYNDWIVYMDVNKYETKKK